MEGIPNLLSTSFNLPDFVNELQFAGKNPDVLLSTSFLLTMNQIGSNSSIDLKRSPPPNGAPQAS